MTVKIPLPAARYEQAIADAEWTKLEAAGGVKLDAQARDEIRRAISGYRDWATVYQSGPRAAEVKPRIAKIEALARKLAAALAPPEGDAPGQGALRALAERALRDRREYPFLPPLAAALQRLGDDAGAEIKNWPRDLGAGSDPHLPPLLSSLCAAYASAGGHGVYTDGAIGFVAAACRLAGANVHSADALRAQIKAARRMDKN